ncbi:9417_t:CDS:2, partial [Funneliformis caledonium]
TPICDDENEEQEHGLNEDIIQSETQKWSQLIDEWIEFGNQENRFGDENDESFLSSEWNSDFNFAGRSVHPADDEIAKWSLTTLFESSLESPLFL